MHPISIIARELRTLCLFLKTIGVKLWDNAVYLVLQPLPLETVHWINWLFLVGRVALLMLTHDIILHLLSAPLEGLRCRLKTPDLPPSLDWGVASLSLPSGRKGV